MYATVALIGIIKSWLSIPVLNAENGTMAWQNKCHAVLVCTALKVKINKYSDVL